LVSDSSGYLHLYGGYHNQYNPGTQILQASPGNPGYNQNANVIFSGGTDVFLGFMGTGKTIYSGHGTATLTAGTVTVTVGPSGFSEC
jgi:hypothetical protein